MNKEFISKFIKNSAIVSIGTIASMAINFFSITILARYLSKDIFGIYILILLVAHLLSIVSGLGLDLTTVKYVSSHKTDRRCNIYPIIQIRALTVFIIVVIFCFSGHLFLNLFDQRISEYIIFISILASFINFRDLFYKLFEGLELFQKKTIIHIISSIIRVSLIIFSLHSENFDIKILIYVEIITAIIALSALILSSPLKHFRHFNVDLNTYKEYLRFGFPIYLSNILSFIYQNLSSLIIGALLNPANLACFNIARKIPAAFLAAFHSFIIVYFPNSSKLFSQGKEKDAQSFMSSSLILCFHGILFMALICFLFRNEIITLIFSDKYQESSMAFALLMLNLSMLTISNIMGYSIVSAGFPSVPVKINSISCTAGLIINIVLIPRLGIIGAVCALLIMSIISLSLFYKYLLKISIAPNAFILLKPFILYSISVTSYLVIGTGAIILKTTMLFTYLSFSIFFMKDDVIKPMINHLNLSQQSNQ